MTTQKSNSNLINSLQEKLEKFRHVGKNTSFKIKDKSSLQPVDKIGVDGINHINIWEKASTELGVALSHMSDLPFTHVTYGKFRSVEGFWHYIRSVSRDDRTRMMAGYKAKKFGDTLESQRIDDFKAIIMDANWQKVSQYAPLIEEIKKSELPFDVYYLYKDDPKVRIRPASAFWLIEGFEEIRKAIKENRLPIFDSLKDHNSRTKQSPQSPVKKPKERHVSATLSPSLIEIVNSREEGKEIIVNKNPELTPSVTVIE